MTLMDEDFNNSLAKQKSGAILVLSYRNLDRVNNTLSELMATPESVQKNADVIKKLTEQKAKETTMISQFAKDNGFSERYAASKSKGANTLSGILRDMELFGYDDAKINLYDIETTEAMRTVSDISAESIFKQLSLTDNDYAMMVKEQGQLIRKKQQTMDAQTEELRLLKEKHLKAELMDEYRRQLEDKKINPQEIEELVADELKYKPSTIGNSFYTAEELEEKAKNREENT